MAGRRAEALVDAARRAFPRLGAIDSRAFLVGGALRDLLLGRTPRDADLALAGAAAEAERFATACRGRAIRLGEAPFDVIRVVADGVVYDFAELVGATVEGDLARRDFTIGAVALPLDGSSDVVDPYGGLADLERRTLRMVRESNFEDDPLRVLRGARLVAELGLEVDAGTLAAMRRHASRVGACAAERVGAEWLALLAAGSALRRGLELVRDLGLGALLTGGALSDEAIGRAAAVAGRDEVTRLAAIALDGDVDALCAVALALGLGASRVDAVRRAVRLARGLASASAIDPVVLHDEGADASRRAVDLLRAAGNEELARRLDSLIATDGERIFDARPLLDGRAIGAIAGIAPGPRIGALRRALLVAQLRGEVRDEGEARALVGQLLAGGGWGC